MASTTPAAGASSRTAWKLMPPNPNESTAALRGDGALLCWGAGQSGQLGNGARSGSSGVPTAVDTDERFVALHAKELWAGPRAVAGRTDDGRIFVWGASPDDGPSWLGYAGPTPVQVPLPGPAQEARLHGPTYAPAGEPGATACGGATAGYRCRRSREAHSRINPSGPLGGERAVGDALVRGR